MTGRAPGRAAAGPAAASDVRRREESVGQGRRIRRRKGARYRAGGRSGGERGCLLQARASAGPGVDTGAAGAEQPAGRVMAGQLRARTTRTMCRTSRPSRTLPQAQEEGHQADAARLAGHIGGAKGVQRPRIRRTEPRRSSAPPSAGTATLRSAQRVLSLSTGRVRVVRSLFMRDNILSEARCTPSYIKEMEGQISTAAR